MGNIRVMIADDHQLFRDGVRTLLATMSDVEVVAEAATGSETVRLALEKRPDVILMDIQMPDMDGIEATRQIMDSVPHVNILMLTMFEDFQSVFAALRAGARGYVLKGAKHDEMLRAIRAVSSGEAIFSPAIATRVIGYFSDNVVAQLPEPFTELTGREREILSLLARGDNNKSIAAQLDLAVKTVRNHVSNILNKLQVADRTQAILRAREAGVGQTEDKKLG